MKIKVLHQIIDPSGAGGVSAEFRALKDSSLESKYEINSMILMNLKPGVSISNILFYKREIQKIKPDIVQIRGAAVDGLNAEIAAKLAGNCKVLLCIHGLYSDMVYLNPFKKIIAKKIIEPLCFKLADSISCVYEKGKDMIQLKRYQEKVVEHVYNRIPDYSGMNKKAERIAVRKWLNISSEKIVGIYCGRVSKEKGMVWFSDVLKKLSTNWPKNLELIFCGDGDYLIDLKNKCEEYGVCGLVHFVGCVNDVPRYLSAADFFFMPSLHENHSIALLEAMAMCLPTITTDVGGNAEIIKDDEFGYLIKPYNTDGFESAIRKMVGLTERAKLKNNIENYSFEEFSNRNADQALDRIYSELMKDE